MKYPKSGRFWEDACPTYWIAGANEINSFSERNSG